MVALVKERFFGDLGVIRVGDGRVFEFAKSGR
jgi:hypothetical protein